MYVSILVLWCCSYLDQPNNVAKVRALQEPCNIVRSRLYVIYKKRHLRGTLRNFFVKNDEVLNSFDKKYNEKNKSKATIFMRCCASSRIFVLAKGFSQTTVRYHYAKVNYFLCGESINSSLFTTSKMLQEAFSRHLMANAHTISAGNVKRASGPNVVFSSCTRWTVY